MIIELTSSIVCGCVHACGRVYTYTVFFDLFSLQLFLVLYSEIVFRSRVSCS